MIELGSICGFAMAAIALFAFRELLGLELFPDTPIQGMVWAGAGALNVFAARKISELIDGRKSLVRKRRSFAEYAARPYRLPGSGYQPEDRNDPGLPPSEGSGVPYRGLGCLNCKYLKLSISDPPCDTGWCRRNSRYNRGME